MGHNSSWSKDCLLIWANSLKNWVWEKQELTSTHGCWFGYFQSFLIFFFFTYALESLIHPAGAQPSTAPFALRLPQNTQKHQQSLRKWLLGSVAGTETEPSRMEPAREPMSGTASSALVCETFIIRSEFSFELICARWDEKLFSLKGTYWGGVLISDLTCLQHLISKPQELPCICR